MEDSTMTDAAQTPLFDGLTFTIIPNAIPEHELHQLVEDITAGGGTLIPFDPAKGRIDKLEEISYIVSATSDFPDYHGALDMYKHVVKPSWVRDCITAMKVKNPRQYSPDPQLIFSDVTICCGNIPQGDKEAIEGGVLAMGGQYMPALAKTVTHLIALDLEDQRCQIALSKKLRVEIVLPHWFDDCLRVGRRISERPYTLPNPEILDRDAGAIPTVRASADIREASNPEPTDEPLPRESEEPVRAIKAFDGKKIMLADDLPLNNRLQGNISQMIRAGGGSLTSSVEEADMYVCNYREGSDYVKASQANKDVGNLSWLYYMITHDTWTNPMRRMMHYPRPRDGIPGFSEFKISISSYTGEARIYLENLVKASGAEFTKTFKQDNTHLITAHKQSEKCEAAEEWGVHVINHLWLEESYARCKVQTLTDPRYTYFPARTNLGEILGQTEIDRDAVEKNFFPKTRKPTTAKAKNASATSRTVSDDPVSHNTPVAAKSRRTKTMPDVETPLKEPGNTDKENETPGTARSRGAKSRALSSLHNAAEDMAKFEKEMKRKGGVVHGGRRDKDAEIAEKPNKLSGRDSISSKRSIDEVDTEEGASDGEPTEEPAQKSKRAKKDKLSPIKFRMLISKIERWADNKDKESKEKAKLRELGLFITEDWKKVDIICAPKIVRTKKFVSALACGPTIVASSYLDYALKHNKLPPPEKHLLWDPDFEKQHNFRLQEALERARQNRGRLLKNWTIFCTERVNGGFDTFKDIIAANGGKCQLWKGRTTTVTAAKRSIDQSDKEVSQNQEEDEGDVLYLISEPHQGELELWKKFRDLAKKHDMIPRIVSTEWLLFVAMAQYVHWDPEWELDEEVVKAKQK